MIEGRILGVGNLLKSAETWDRETSSHFLWGFSVVGDGSVWGFCLIKHN